ncbi:MAG: hypothetical protein QHI48_08425 [Bacteroidota bacterium]|nr:hypothetical protein [Bacteroidota bacterium]
MIARFRFVLCVAALTATAFSQKGETVEVRIDNDTVRILNKGAVENCAAEFKVMVHTAGTVVTVIERDTNVLKADCICRFDFEAGVSGLAPGNYTAEVYREYLRRYGYGVDTLVFVGSAPFTVSTAAGNMASFGKAGPCHDLSATDAPPMMGTGVNVSFRPFSGDAVISFGTDTREKTEIILYDAASRHIGKLFDGELAAGHHELVLPRASFPASGTYYMVIAGSREIRSAKIQVAK